MTESETIHVQGACGHEFDVIVPKDCTYFLSQDNLERILMGRIAITHCPECGQEVSFYHEFVINTFCERIGLFPLEWKERIMSKTRNFDTLIFERYGGPFLNLQKHLINIGVLTVGNCLSEEYKEKS